MKGTKGIEKQVLEVVAGLGGASPEGIGRKICVGGKYVGELCATLVGDGYLAETHEDEFILTPRGREKISKTISRGHIAVLKGG